MVKGSATSDNPLQVNMEKGLDVLDSSTQNESQDKTSSLNYGEPKPVPSYDFPDGGWRAWGVVLGCFLLSLTSYGQLNAFGAFQTYYSTNLLKGHSDSAISWIGSIQLTFMYLLGLVIGRLFDRYDTWVLFIPGCLLSTFSLLMTSISTRYYQVLLSQGIGQGIAIALISCPAMFLPSQWFLRKRALATGIVVAGSSLSGVIFPIMISRLIPKIGFPWTVRTLALLNFALQVISIPLARKRLPSRLGLPLFDKAWLKDAPFLLYATSNALITFGLFAPFFYIELYALSQGVSPNLAFYMISIMNAGGVIGRISSGAIADKVGRFNVLIQTALFAGIFCLALWTNSHSVGTIVAFSFLYGLTSASFQSLGVSCVAQITPDPRIIGARMGIVMFGTLSTPGILTGPVIAGSILGRSGGAYLWLQVFVGIVLLAAAVSATIVRYRMGPRSLFAKF